MSSEPEELGMDWDIKPQAHYDIAAVIDLAYAMDQTHDLRRQNFRLAQKNFELLTENGKLKSAFARQRTSVDFRQELIEALKKEKLELESEVENLRATVSDLEFNAEVHECYEDHDDCFAAESVAEIEQARDNVQRVVMSLKDKRDELYWTFRREGKSADRYLVEEVIRFLNDILGELNV